MVSAVLSRLKRRHIIVALVAAIFGDGLNRSTCFVIPNGRLLVLSARRSSLGKCASNGQRWSCGGDNNSRDRLCKNGNEGVKQLWVSTSSHSSSSSSSSSSDEDEFTELSSEMAAKSSTKGDSTTATSTAASSTPTPPRSAAATETNNHQHQSSSTMTTGHHSNQHLLPSSQKSATHNDNDIGNRGSTAKGRGSSGSGAIRKRKRVRRRRMELSWCARDSPCRQVIRERVVGEHNHIEFEGPATGQVIFSWSDLNVPSSEEEEEEEEEDVAIAVPTVLLLVRQNSDELMRVAANAVQELEEDGMQVLLQPDLAAKLKHYFGVDDRMIKLFEPRPVPGFGGSHIPLMDDTATNEGGYNSIGSAYYDLTSDMPAPATTATSGPPWIDLERHRHNKHESGPDPDLIVTLGGDGLLMHASMLFPGPVPPILCVAGGSLGFLTPFAKEEMVDAIRKALGLIRDEGEGDDDADENDEGCPTNRYKNGGFSSVGVRPLMPQTYVDDNGTKWSGQVTVLPHLRESKPKFSFGAYNRICLSMRMRLDCRIINREGVVRARFNVLNEVAIDRGSSPYLANLECFCDDVHLTTVQADGIIFSTPTGSTAYSMAAGGSVVHPGVPAILVTPICPHVLSFRSMVFPDHVVLRCYVPDDARADACVAFDGRYRRELHRGDSVQIQMSAYPVPTINRADHSSDWLNSLKRNFNFNTRARQMPL